MVATPPYAPGLTTVVPRPGQATWEQGTADARREIPVGQTMEDFCFRVSQIGRIGL